MKIYRNLEDLPKIKNAIVTQGTFDGVHLAHKVIINRLKELAKLHDGETVVMTFDPHPRFVLYPDDDGLRILHSLDEKIDALDEAGVDHLVVIPFTKEFSNLSSLQFIRDIIVDKIGTKILVIGYNHRFGKNREGSFDHLKDYSSQYGFEVVEISEQEVDQLSVSSTRIRQALKSGDVITANKYLGREYSIRGSVIHGNKLGRRINFPTANIFVSDAHKLIPSDGVYAVRVKVGKTFYNGMLNSGYRPTIEGKSYSIEINIFNFDRDIYGEIISVSYVDKLRNEIKFNSVQELKNQLEKDKLQSIQILAHDILND